VGDHHGQQILPPRVEQAHEQPVPDRGGPFDHRVAGREERGQQNYSLHSASFEQIGGVANDRFVAVDDVHINGKLTLGENIGDVSGVAVAYKAYQRTLGGEPAPTIDGYTGDQRFFIGWAQIWLRKYRDDEARKRLYVMTRFDNSIVAIDLADRAVVQRVGLFNPEPDSLVAGRPFFYDARATSSRISWTSLGRRFHVFLLMVRPCQVIEPKPISV